MISLIRALVRQYRRIREHERRSRNAAAGLARIPDYRYEEGWWPTSSNRRDIDEYNEEYRAKLLLQFGGDSE